MKKKQGWKKLRRREYGRIKQMLKLGIPREMVVKITGRSYSTVFYVSKSKDLREYRELTHKTNGTAEKQEKPRDADILALLKEINRGLETSQKSIQTVIGMLEKKPRNG